MCSPVLHDFHPGWPIRGHKLRSSLGPGKDEGRWPQLLHCKKAFLVVGQSKVRGTMLGPCGKGDNSQMLDWGFLKKKKSELFRNKGRPRSPLPHPHRCL